jgi:hypothetical protein
MSDGDQKALGETRATISREIEQATGRKVRSFLWETDIDQDVSVETFLLAYERTDMTGFENA